jgi:predicted ester cyclase
VEVDDITQRFVVLRSRPAVGLRTPTSKYQWKGVESPTENKARVTRLLDAVNTRDAEVISTTIDDLYEPDAVIHTPVQTNATGRQAIKDGFTRLHSAFPDLNVATDDLIAKGDKVAACNSFTGTHRCEYMGGSSSYWQDRHVRRDRHLSFCRKTDRREPGRRRCPLTAVTAWRLVEWYLMTATGMPGRQRILRLFARPIDKGSRSREG